MIHGIIGIWYKLKLHCKYLNNGVYLNDTWYNWYMV